MDHIEPLRTLENWHASLCDGDWEHTYGIKIGTLDNPGWMVRIDTRGTPLEYADYPEVRRTDDAREWIDCRIRDGTFLGAGTSCVADRSGKPNIRQALVNAMRSALRAAGIQPEEVGHINAHGLGGRLADLEEARAIHDVFGAFGSQVPVVGLKGFLGNTGAGDGALQLAASLLALRNGCLPLADLLQRRQPGIDVESPHRKRVVRFIRGYHGPNVAQLGHHLHLFVFQQVI